jgi:uncharacterized membrane protein
MSNKRPRIKVPFESIDIIMEGISISLILLMVIYAAMEYTNLPESIPTHFNAKGEPDDYSNKTTIWLLPIIATVTYIGLFIINKYPHIHNYMVNITEENALKNYRFSTRIVRIVNLLTIVLFTYITYHIIQSAKGTQIELGSLFLPIVIGCSVILPIGILIYMKKLNKNN